MGLFDLFKRKSDKKPNITFETLISNHGECNPWDKKQGNDKNDYTTVIFLHMLSSKPHQFPKSPDDFPRYVSYDLDIHDPIKFFAEMLKNGFLQKATTADTLKTLKVAELKQILIDNGIEAKDRSKAALISKIENLVPDDKLKCPEMYSVSDKGVSFIERNADLLKLFRNPCGVSYAEYIAVKANREYLSYNDVIWGVLNRRDMLSYDYTSKRQNEYHRAVFLKDEKRMDEALRYFIHTLFYDLNNPTRIIPDWAKKDWDGEVLQISPDVLENIFELKEFYVPKMAEECYSLFDLPRILVKEKTFAQLLSDIFNAQNIDAKDYLPKGCR